LAQCLQCPDTRALSPGQELLNRHVISGPRVRVPDRDRKKPEELFAGGWAGTGDECGGWKESTETRESFSFPAQSGRLRRYLTVPIHSLVSVLPLLLQFVW
jgi:hypothetical protein